MQKVQLVRNIQSIIPLRISYLIDRKITFIVPQFICNALFILFE